MRNNKGAVTLYVLLAMLTISAFLMAIYIRNTNAEKAQEQITAKIKNVYEDYNFTEAYETIKNSKPEIKGFSIKDEKLTIETYTSNGINVDQNGKKILYYALTTSNAQPEETQWQNENTIDVGSIETGTNIYLWIKNEKNVTSEAYVTVKPLLAGEYAEEENRKYIDSKGNEATIPAGFTVSNIEGEKSISTGLVIYSGEVTDWTTDSDSDGIVDAQENYNQYVWIPVEKPSEELYGTLDSEVDGIEGTEFGKLYDFGNSTDGYVTSASTATALNWPTDTTNYSAISYREPSVLSSYDTDSQYYYDILGYADVDAYKAGMQKEFNDMITSVEEYKGFYIGRYELTGTASEPTVKKGLSPLVETNWYNFYNACTNLEAGNTAAQDKVRTTIIWGCQWDQAVKMSLTDKDDFLTSAATYGVYSENGTSGVQPAGTKTAAYNIYDMGGNVYDWTVEALTTDRRTHRGGCYIDSSTLGPASYRGYYQYPNYSVDNDGCRPQLYIQ